MRKRLRDVATLTNWICQKRRRKGRHEALHKAFITVGQSTTFLLETIFLSPFPSRNAPAAKYARDPICKRVFLLGFSLHVLAAENHSCYA
jgi:hypothetical protein